MEITWIAPNFAVSPQLRPGDLPLAREAGYRAIVNNRPDGEGADQPASEALEREARRLGLGYSYIPVVPGQMSDAQARALAAAVAAAGGPVLAFCRTGNRSTKLWEMAQRRG